MPDTINDKLYADFSKSYEDGLEKMIDRLRLGRW